MCETQAFRLVLFDDRLRRSRNVELLRDDDECDDMMMMMRVMTEKMRNKKFTRWFDVCIDNEQNFSQVLF